MGVNNVKRDVPATPMGKLDRAVEASGKGLVAGFVAIDALSASRNILAGACPHEMAATTLNQTQEAFSGLAAAAGILIAASGVVLLVHGMRDLANAESTEKKVMAVMQILYGLIMVAAGVAYSIFQIASLTHDTSLNEKMFLPIQVGIYSVYGAGILINLAKGILKLSFRQEVKKHMERGDLKSWLLQASEDEQGVRRERNLDEYLEMRCGYKEAEIKEMTESELATKVLARNWSLIVKDGVNFGANILGGAAFDLAIFPQHYFLGGDSALGVSISSWMFVAAAAAFVTVDSNLLPPWLEKRELAKKKAHPVAQAAS